MRLEEVNVVVQGLPNMTLDQARRMAQFIERYDARDILELGFCHGVSTCYMAAALQHLRRGKITTIDLEVSKQRSPNIEALLDRLNLREYVEVIFEQRSYTWRLMKFLEEGATKCFDLCYLDGAHTWYVDGFAFFLVDRLLRMGGWIIFDDLDWTYGSSQTLKNSEQVRALPAEERETAQVRRVYELLVKTHPCYGEFKTADGWAYARKVSDSPIRASQSIVQEVVIERQTIGLGALALRAYQKLKR